MNNERDDGEDKDYVNQEGCHVEGEEQNGPENNEDQRQEKKHRVPPY